MVRVSDPSGQFGGPGGHWHHRRVIGARDAGDERNECWSNDLCGFLGQGHSRDARGSGLTPVSWRGESLDQALWLYVMLSSGFVAFFGSAPAEPFFRSLIATRKASSFSPSWDVADDVGTLGRRSLEAKVWSARRGSSPQPPSVARRARLEVVVPTRQHWTKRLMSSVCVLTDCGCLYHCRIHRSLRGPLTASAATSR